MKRTPLILHGGLLSVVLTALACSSGTNETQTPGTTDPGDPKPLPSTGGNEDGVFESAHPSGLSETRTQGPTGGAPGVGQPTPGGVPATDGNAGATGSAGDPNGPTSPAVPPTTPEAPPDEGEVARAIEEADVIKRVGDRLYALSAIGGLTVVDIAEPDDMKLLGRFRATATPFEMYVRDETVFVLYNGYGEYTYDEDSASYTYYQTSYVMALDVSDPTAIAEQQRFEIPGYIADSRLVGDALYVVAYDDAYCYRCGDTPQTHVMSLNVSNPGDIQKVDEINFDERQDGYGWGRSLSGNDQRLYVAGPNYGGSAQPEGSVIQVIDITDASGDMQEGASLEVAGQINSRWQMDEYEGVLRVVSQPLSWSSETVPRVETFEIVSSDELNPLGFVDLTLPEAETLQAVRFDGSRGYAITFRQTDPLFTLDLSDPANPLQAGELQMPGWVYHMEPRGDRLVGLGYDQGNSEGGLTVSLFDVSDLTTPTMIDRVNFGGAWGQLAEDQNRIHKSFQVLDADELVLIPFSGYDYSSVDTCSGYGKYISGVQLVNFEGDDLTLAGIAPSQGLARRAFLHKERLLTMSDERLEAFDIADRNAPESMSKVDLAQIVNQLEVAGESVIRIGSSYWANGRGLEATVSNLEDLVDLEPGKTVSFDDINVYSCTGESYLRRVLTGGDRAYFLYDSYHYNDSSKSNESRVKVLDVSDPNAPVVAGDGDLGFFPQSGYNTVPGMVNNGQDALAVGDALVFTNHSIQYNDLGFIIQNNSTLEIVDLTDPNQPVRKSVTLPASLGSTGLLKSGSVIATSHFEAAPDNVDAVRFYLDRVDVSDASAPELLGSVNIPGSLLSYDHELKRALTIDYRYVNIENISPKQCYEEEFGKFMTNDPSLLDYENARGPCTALRFELHLVDVSGDKAQIVDSYDVDKGVNISVVAVGDDRVFLGTGQRYTYGDIAQPGIARPPVSGPTGIGGVSIGYWYYPVTVGSAKLLVASGLGGDELTVASTELQTTDNFYGFTTIVAKGKKAAVAAGWQNQMSIIDAADAEAPVVAEPIELPGSVSDLDLVGDTAVAALGPAGVHTVSLSSDE